jgi:hypothetical protein
MAALASSSAAFCAAGVASRRATARPARANRASRVVTRAVEGGETPAWQPTPPPQVFNAASIKVRARGDLLATPRGTCTSDATGA